MGERISFYSLVCALPKVMFSSAFHFYCFRLPPPSLASAHLHRSACCLSARLLLSPVVGAGVES